MTQHTISFFNRKTDATPKEKTVTWLELGDWLKNPIVRAKKDGAAFAPSQFSKPRRLLINVIELCWLVLDCDHCNDIEAVIKVFRNLNLRFVVYSTHSSKRVTESNPGGDACYRIIIELSSPIPAKLFPALWQWAQMLSGGRFDEACKDASRLHYKPAKATHDAQYEYYIIEGEPFDWSKLNLHPIIEKAPKVRSKKAPTTVGVDSPVPITVDDEKILEFARQRFGAKFERLYSGDSSDYPKKNKKNGEPDVSAADEGFVVRLCYAGATDEQVALIWKASGRNRAKLYTHKTYVQKTTDSARKWIASHQDEENEAALEIIDEQDPPITTDKQLEKYLRQIARNTAKVLDSVRLLFLYLGFEKHHSRLLNALIRKGRDKLRPFDAKHQWLLEQYVANGEKSTTEKTLSRDIHKLLIEQKGLGVEIIKYWPGYTNLRTGKNQVSRFQNLFLRFALEAINEAIETSGDYEYSWQALEAACKNVASRIPRKEIPPKDSETEKETSINANKEKQKAIEQTRKYLEILLAQGNAIEIVEGEAQEIFFEALCRAMHRSQGVWGDKMSTTTNSEMEVFTIQ